MVRVNPFIFRRPVTSSEFIGRSKELRQVFDSINNCESISLAGPRRVGKTSLLHHISLSSTFKDYGIDRDRYILILIDLLKMEDPWDEIDLLNLMMEGLIEESRLDESYYFERNSRSRLERILERLIKKDNKKIGILFDEFEIAAYNERLKSDFYGYLRSLISDKGYIGSIFYITSSVFPISHLIKEDPKRLSPFSNIFLDTLIQPFTKNEARELLSRGEFPSWLIDFIIENIGTHPYLLQIIGWCAFNIQREKGKITEEDLVVLKEEFITKAKGYFDYFFNKFMREVEREIYEDIKKEKEQDKVIEEYLEKNREEIENLRSGGLILVDPPKLSLWFDEGIRRL